MIYSQKQGYVLLNANRRWNILHGAVRSGKTHVSYDLATIRVKTQPAGNCWMIGKTERTLERNVLAPMRERFGSHYVSPITGKNAECYIFGRRFYVVGANDERSVDKIQGASMVYAYGDEITTWPKSFFEMLKSRLDKKGAKFDGTCNPQGQYHWLKTEMIDKAGELNIFEQRFTLDDGAAFLDPDFVASLKAEYTGVWYKRMIDGLWVVAEGIVYDMWDEVSHVIDVPPIGKDGKPIRAEWYGVSVDYGTNNPCTFGLYGVNGELCWQEDEYYYDSSKTGRQKTDAEYAEDMKEFCRGRDVRVIIVDPSASSLKAEFRKTVHGLPPVKSARNEVIPGIQTVSRKLKNGTFKIMRCCKESIREKSSYCWDKKAQERGEDAPLKKDDHCSDRERYFLHTVFGRER